MFKFLKSREKPSQQPFQLSNLVEILQDGVSITNVSGEMIYLNRAGFNLLGIPNTSDLGKYNFLEHFVEDHSRIDFLKNQINEQGLVRNHELPLRKVNKDSLDVILTVNVIGDFRQQTIGFLFLFKDVTEIKKIQEQLLQSQKLESIGMMASGIAHDFNNILAAIIPNAELIKYSAGKDTQNFKRAEIIEKSAHRASDIASRLLTFTRHKDQQFNKLLNLNQIIEDSLDLMEHSIPDKIQISKNFDKSLIFIKGDDSQIQQIVMNLIINAIDAMPEGGNIQLITENFLIDHHYQVGSLDPGRYTRLTIQDSGTGIPMEVLPRIFDPFFTTKEIGKGTGLGLSVVYGIVKSLNGHIEVDSIPESGTKFEIYLPGEKGAVSPKNGNPKKKVEPKDLHLLIVDDEDYVLNILGDILEFLGYRVTKKSSSLEAIEYYEQNKDDLDYIVVDLKMPKMDGRATSSALKKINPNVKVIYTSGFDDSPMSKEDLNGVVGFLKKPYSINQVSKVIEGLMGK